MRTLGAHRMHIAGIPPSRVSRLSGARYDPVQTAHQSALIRLASITESFCAEALVAAAESLSQPGLNPTMQIIWNDAVISATRTWHDQKKSYDTWLQVKVSWETIDAIADARNAVAHGLGSLTRQQLRNETAVQARLKKLGVSVIGRNVELSDSSLYGLGARCRDFIVGLDAALQARLSAP